MKQRGRKTTLAVVHESAISAVDRPDPPQELTIEQRIEWIRVVNSLQAEWFEDYSTAALTQYCKHVISARRISSLIEDACLPGKTGDDAPVFTVGYYDTLLKMQERESRILLSLMTKMRLTQQATYHPEKGKNKGVSPIKPPWED